MIAHKYPTTHPAGYHQGIVAGVRDAGVVDTQHGLKPKVILTLENTTGHRADLWLTKTPGPRAPLPCLRAALSRRLLAEDERRDMDPARLSQELTGRPVGYIVDHRESRTGRVYANVLWVWPLVAQAA